MAPYGVVHCHSGMGHLLVCNGDKILTEIKCRQVKPTELRCTADDDCWCMRLKTKFTHPDDKEDCMSPQEMLNQTSVFMSDSDRVYLQGLLGREFISNTEIEV